MFDLEVNARITKIRKERKLSKKAVAKMLGLNYSTYVRMENEGHINTYYLKKLAEIFDVDVRMILYGEVPQSETTSQQPIPAEPKEPEIVLGYKCTNITLSVMEMVIINEVRRLSLKDVQEVGDFIIKKVTGRK